MKAKSDVDKKTKKKRRLSRKWIIIPLIVIIGSLIFIFTRDEGPKINVFKEVETLQEKGEPYVLVLTDSKSLVGKKESKNIESIVNKAPKNLSVFVLDKNKTKEIDYFVDLQKVVSLPSIVLVNGKGETLKVFPAPLTVDQINEAISQIPVPVAKEE